MLGTGPTDGIADGAIARPFMTRATSEELGVRTNSIPKVNLQGAFFRIDFSSELTYDADEGVNDAGAPSRRQGFELSGQYHPLSWLELNADIASTHARYFTGNPGVYGLPGLYVANAPNFIGSFGLLADHPCGIFGGVQFRWLGSYPLIEDNSMRSHGYKEVNLDVGYHITKYLQVQASIYNLTNTHASASQYAYDYRLTPTSPVETGSTYHPLEPRSARFSHAVQRAHGAFRNHHVSRHPNPDQARKPLHSHVPTSQVKGNAAIRRLVKSGVYIVRPILERLNIKPTSLQRSDNTQRHHGLARAGSGS